MCIYTLSCVQLKYAEVEHKTGSDEKTVHGVPRVEYKEVWHQY